MATQQCRGEQDGSAPDRAGQLRPVATTLIGLALSAVLVLIGGRWDWFEGWVLAGLFTAYLVGTICGLPAMCARAEQRAYPGGCKTPERLRMSFPRKLE